LTGIFCFMLNGLLGQKSSQTQGFLADGKRIPITVVRTLGNTISQVKTTEKEGYNSVQISLGNKKKANKAEEGHSKKAGMKQTPRFLKELRLDDVSEFTVGAEIAASEIFKQGDIVDVVGVSKGKGFAGGVKRHHFKGGPRTHGQSDRERAPGSIGQTTTPGRVYKGKRMASRMGHETVTVKNLQVIEIKEDGTVILKGLVPGPLESLIIIKKVGESKNFVPLFKLVEETGEVVSEASQGAQSAVEVQDETVKEEVVEESTDHSSISDDAQKTQEDSSESKPSSLSESQSPIVEENETVISESTLDSSENRQAISAEDGELNQEKKEDK
jgi:large subunit ribosomal protein L3